MTVTSARRARMLRICLIFLVIVVSSVASYGIVELGGQRTTEATLNLKQDTVGSTVSAPSARRVVVSQVNNVPNLDPHVMIITSPLGVNFKMPGALYGTIAKRPIQLGPRDTPGTTVDALGYDGSQIGILLPDGRRLLYHFWHQLASFPTHAPGDPEVADGTHLGTPTIRMRDLATGKDAILLTGARSMAWRSDGMFAYAQGVDSNYRYNVPYLQRVVVQRGLDGSPEVWTSDADRYTVLQWAGDFLLVLCERLGGASELLMLRGPDMVERVLMQGDRFLCVSPDGTHIVAASGLLDGKPLTLRLISLETGSMVDSLSLNGIRDPASGEPVFGVSGGAWMGNTLVVTLAPADLAILSISNGRLGLEEVITFRYPRLRPGSALNPVLNDSGRKVFFVTREGPDSGELERTAVLSYDLDSGECRRWIAPGMPAVTRIVTNMNRSR